MKANESSNAVNKVNMSKKMIHTFIHRFQSKPTSWRFVRLSETPRKQKSSSISAAKREKKKMAAGFITV